MNLSAGLFDRSRLEIRASIHHVAAFGRRAIRYLSGVPDFDTPAAVVPQGASPDKDLMSTSVEPDDLKGNRAHCESPKIESIIPAPPSTHALESRARRAAARVGLKAIKSRKRVGSHGNRGGFRLTDEHNKPAMGNWYELSAGEVIEFCRPDTRSAAGRALDGHFPAVRGRVGATSPHRLSVEILACRAATMVGLTAIKSNRRVGSVNNYGGFRLVDRRGRAVCGKPFNVSAKDVLKLCAGLHSPAVSTGDLELDILLMGLDSQVPG